MEPVAILGLLAAALTLSFVFWIFVAYGSARFLRLGVCSVCGAVVTIWAANLLFGFLPGWVTLLLIGQSVVGGAALLRDATLLATLPATMPNASRQVLSQLTWFAFILGGTATLGFVGLVLDWDGGMPAWEAAHGVLVLDVVLVVAFLAAVALVFLAWSVAKVRTCQVCLAVSSVWIGNLFLQALPAWVTVLLLGQSVAGGAALGRDWAGDRLRIEERPERERRLVKQGTYFAVLLAGTIAAAVIVMIAVPDVPA